jgi:hypothetical protein
VGRPGNVGPVVGRTSTPSEWLRSRQRSGTVEHLAVVVLVVVSAIAAAALGLRWNRWNAPIPIGEGIRAIGRIAGDDAAPARRSSDHAAGRRRQIRLASTATLCLLLAVCVMSSHRRGLAEFLAVVLLLRVTFEMLAHRARRTISTRRRSLRRSWHPVDERYRTVLRPSLERMKHARSACLKQWVLSRGSLACRCGFLAVDRESRMSTGASNRTSTLSRSRGRSRPAGGRP